ncbi:hypothetical protein OIU77_005923 [Salix suchowensis]|uniref:NADH dehydrogenase [ubiquinone] 1 alpha subcomplex subunit 12 n=1 Tax=Salix suchowensis TaxID=1278906 RepID=A0ABQ9AR57_9ROSI|nr:hypothetical protein OIU77_005923 [Salix suchowensis]
MTLLSSSPLPPPSQGVACPLPTSKPHNNRYIQPRRPLPLQDRRGRPRPRSQRKNRQVPFFSSLVSVLFSGAYLASLYKAKKETLARLAGYLNNRTLVGVDKVGNRHFTRTEEIGGIMKEKRWVVFKGEEDPTSLPAEWICWLNGQRKRAPTPEVY